MSELTTVSTKDSRAVAPDTGRKEAAAEIVKAATSNPTGGRKVPPAAVSEATANTRQKQASADQRVERAVAKLNDYVQSFQRDLKFTVNEDLGRPIVHVVDRNTQEVIRQIPNDVTIRLARNLKALEQERIAASYGDGQGSGAPGVRLGLINTRI